MTKNAPALAVAALAILLLTLALPRATPVDLVMAGPSPQLAELTDLSAIATLLRRHPTDPYGWLMLAQARWAAGDAPSALAAFRRSHDVGAVAPALALRRVELALRLWLVLQPEDRVRLKAQIALAWINAPKDLSRLGGQESWAAGFIRAALPDNEAMRRDFDRWGKSDAS